jgi:DNA-binding transcriptional LysR family regulator
MTLDWSDLQVLLAVCTHGSASSAARALEVDKATVSRRITGLERSLGVRLMQRRASGWKPTRAGERVAAAARAMHTEELTLTSDLVGQHGSPRTQVHFTAPLWFCAAVVLPEVGPFLAANPWLDLAVAARSRVLNLAQREADLAVRNRRPEQGELVVRKAGELGSALYASRGWARAHRYSPGSLAGQRLVGYPDRISYVPGFAWLEEARQSSAGLVRADDAQALAAAIAAGAGIGVLPCILGDREPGLVRLGDQVHRETIWLVSPTELASTRAVKVLLAFVLEVWRKNASALAG